MTPGSGTSSVETTTPLTVTTAASRSIIARSVIPPVPDGREQIKTPRLTCTRSDPYRDLHETVADCDALHVVARGERIRAGARSDDHQELQPVDGRDQHQFGCDHHGH